MPTKRLSMRKIHEVLRLKFGGGHAAHDCGEYKDQSCCRPPHSGRLTLP